MNKINWMNKDRVLARQIACALLATGIGVVSGLVVTEVAWNWGIGTAKVKKSDLIKYWDRLDIDEWKRKAIALALF